MVPKRPRKWAFSSEARFLLSETELAVSDRAFRELVNFFASLEPNRSFDQIDDHAAVEAVSGISVLDVAIIPILIEETLDGESISDSVPVGELTELMRKCLAVDAKEAA